MNPDPFQHWHGVENVARVRINGESCVALLDIGAQINTITPKYVSGQLLQMGLITDLLGAKVTCIGLGNAYMRPLSYVVIRVQVDGGQGYDEDKIALVILDLSNFAARVPVILGTPTISYIISVMKEKEIDTLVGGKEQYGLPTDTPKENLVARAVVAIPVPKPPMETQLQRENKPQDPHTPKLTVRQRHRKLFDGLDLSGLDSWPLELVDATHWLLAKYHDMFLLDPAELGSTHSTEHMIKVADDITFKEWFRQISLPLVEEVRNCLQEMLESGTIRPSQRVWYNAVVLVRKKDGGL